MSKYIIDIPNGVEWGVVTCRTEDGFYTRDFDSLEELNIDYINEHYGELQEEAYQAGLQDAWGTARALVWDTSISEYETAGANVESWDNETCNVLRDYSAQEAAELFRKIREHKDSDRIEVGDEVQAPRGKAIVTAVKGDFVHYFYSDGEIGFGPNNVTKTGKHYDIASILEAMRE